MLLIRTYHESDFLPIQSLIQLDDLSELSKLKSMLSSNYSLVCEIIGKPVGFVVFFSDQSHIATIYAQDQRQEEILTALLQRLEAKSQDSQIKHITIDINAPYQPFWQAHHFTLSASKQNLIKTLP